LRGRILVTLAATFILGCLANAQVPSRKESTAIDTQPAADLASSMAQQLSHDLHVKTVIGEPIKAGSVTLIPIVMMDINFGGGAIAAPPGPVTTPRSPVLSADAFFTSGEARPLGFIAITKNGTRFISVARPPSK